jgi:hypothetical protein
MNGTRAKKVILCDGVSFNEISNNCVVQTRKKLKNGLPMANLIRNWHEKSADTGCICMGKSSGQVWAHKQVCSAGLST